MSADEFRPSASGVTEAVNRSNVAAEIAANVFYNPGHPLPRAGNATGEMSRRRRRRRILPRRFPPLPRRPSRMRQLPGAARSRSRRGSSSNVVVFRENASVPTLLCNGGELHGAVGVSIRARFLPKNVQRAEIGPLQSVDEEYRVERFLAKCR